MNACVHSFCNSFFHVSSFHSIPVFHSFSHSFIQSVIHSFHSILSFNHSFIHSIPFIHLFHLIPLMHSCIHSFNHSCMPSFTKSFFFLHLISFHSSFHVIPAFSLRSLFLSFFHSMDSAICLFVHLFICSVMSMPRKQRTLAKSRDCSEPRKAVARRPRTRPTRLARLHCRRSSMGSAKLAPSRLELEYLALHLTGRAPQAFAST